MTRVELHQMTRKRPGKSDRKVWILRWWDSNGKRLGETIGEVGDMAKRDAEKLQRAKQSSFDSGQLKADKPRAMTLADFKTFHNELVRSDMSGGTMVQYDYAFAQAEAVAGKDARLSDITPLTVSKIRNAMNDAGREPPTIGKTLAYLKAAFTRAKKHNLIRENPFTGVTVKNATKAKAAVIRSHEEIQRLKAEAPNTWWRAAIGLWFTGLRLEEAMAMQWADVDFKAGTVTITKRKGGTFKVNGVTYPVLPWQAKTENSYRTVPLPADTMAALSALQSASDGSLYVFVTLTRLLAIQAMIDAGTWGPERRLLDGVLRNWHRIQKRVLGPDVKLASVHDCRKTFCTHAADIIPIQTLAQIVGDTVAVLTKHYTQPKVEHADAIRKAFNGTPPMLKLAS